MAEQTTVALFKGDPRCQTLCDALLDLIYERGRGLPLPLILGVLRLVEHSLIDEHKSA
jgi:hypothetical protein